MTRPLQFGSPEWLQFVWTSGPAIDQRSKRYGHRFFLKTPPFEQELVTIGRPEYVAAVLLAYLYRLGIVRRAKAQPFSFSVPKEGGEQVPDYLFEWIPPPDTGLYVVEAKTHRYVNREQERLLQQNAKYLDRFNLQYLLWTEKSPMTRVFMDNIQRIYHAAGENVGTEGPPALLHLFDRKDAWHLGEIYEYGFDLMLVESLAWCGRLHLPLFDAYDEHTLIQRHCVTDFSVLLHRARPDPEAWWNSLSDP